MVYYQFEEKKTSKLSIVTSVNTLYEI